MKRNISDILHSADDKTLSRIADNNKAADKRTYKRIYKKCLSRMDTGSEHTEVFNAETVRKAPRLYPVLAALVFVLVISGIGAAKLKMKAPKPIDDTPDIMTTETTVSVTTEPDDEQSPIQTTAVTSVTEYTAGNTGTKAVDAVITGNSTQSVKTASSKTNRTNTAGHTARTTTTTTTAPRVTTQSSGQSRPGTKQLTTKDIIELAKKGDALTWSDFEGYIHEDVGSGLYIWEFRIEEGSGYTLRVGGVPPEKPNYIKLYHGISGIDTQSGIDIRYNDVQEFINMPIRVSSAMNQIKELIPDSIASIEISDNVHSNTEKLTYDQIKILLTRLNEISLIEESGSYQLLSCINYKIKITLHNRNTIDLGLVGSYFIINGKGYKAESDSCSQLETYIYNFITNTKEPENIDISGLSIWCWHDYWAKSFDSRNMNESIIVSAFPDTVFTWNGLEGGITVYKNGTAVAAFGGMPLWNAYFTDLNSDGFPELCMTVSFGSGIIDEHIMVYDLRNEKEYTLWERMENDYILFMEDNELFVRKTDYESVSNSNWANDMSMGEKGRLKINSNDELVFVPVS